MTSIQRILLEVEDYAIFVLSPEGLVSSWNRGAEKIKGYSESEILNLHHRIFYTQEDKESRLPETLLDQAAREGRVMHEGWRVRKDGRRFWASVTITALHDENEEIIGFLKVTRDLTDRKSAEDRVTNYAEELKQKSEELRRSEERYQKMISEVQDYAIILLDKNGNILDWNKGAEKVKGYKPKEIVGKNFRLFYTREDKEKDLPSQLLQKAVENGSVSQEGWRLRKDGTRFWANVVITVLHDPTGQIIGFSKVTKDLTERKAAEDRLSNFTEELKQANEILKKNEERYHKMIAEVQDYAIILLSPAGIIEDWNAGAEVIKGYTPAEIIGQHFSVFYPPDDRKRGLPDQLINEAAVTGRALHEGWRVRKDGTRFWGSVVITALHDDQKRIIGFSKVTRDLTERNAAEQALKASAAQLALKNTKLERMNSELSSFAYFASHDLKEPLRKIQLFAGRIESREILSDAGKSDMEKVKNSSSRMQALIEDLLAFAQISNDEGAFEPVDLNDIIHGVLNDLELAVLEKDAHVDVDPLPVIMGNESQLHQLFINLIGNSLKFSKPDVSPQVKVSATIIEGPNLPVAITGITNKFHQITVADHGIGFEPEQAEKIFEAFRRLHGKNVFAGTGIGLAIVRKVVDNHQGVVVAEGKPGQGATFRIFLPVTEEVKV